MPAQDAIQRRLRSFRKQRQSTPDNPGVYDTPAAQTTTTPASSNSSPTSAPTGGGGFNITAPGSQDSAQPYQFPANDWYMQQQQRNMPNLADPNIPWEWQEQWQQPKSALQEAIERYQRNGWYGAK